MDEKYIELLLNKCTELAKRKILFIHYNIEIQDFVNKIIQMAKELGVEDIYLDQENPVLIHDFLKSCTLEDIAKADYFDQHIWDIYATKQASFLILETEYIGLMDDIPTKKIAIAAKQKRESKPLYRKLVEKCELSWCIAAYPGQNWAKSIFGDDQSYEKLQEAIYKICLVDQKDPLGSWDQQLRKLSLVMQQLNRLNIEKLYYSNSLGTSLTLYLPKNYLFSSARDRDIIVNMPSYEVFTSPDFRKTEGIVYGSKPLIYNGRRVEDFWLKFSQGKVVEYDARIGKDILKEIIQADDHSCYLGECALVEKSSPIAQLGITFGTTLIDENASCHIALGAGFGECIEDGLNLLDAELLDKGINVSKIHVDFMIGTPDLTIQGVTLDGKKIPIFIEGRFAPHLMEELE